MSIDMWPAFAFTCGTKYEANAKILELMSDGYVRIGAGTSGGFGFERFARKLGGLSRTERVAVWFLLEKNWCPQHCTEEIGLVPEEKP